MNLSRLSWYWHRLRAMNPAEMGAHLRKKLYQRSDACHKRDWTSLRLETRGVFPKLPAPAAAPTVLREALRRDAEAILDGRWLAFGHLELKVDDPPRWHRDYFVGKDLLTTESAFKLNHRELPGGADIKLIWELSRWYQLVRLAQAAYVLDDARAARKCVRWLEYWVEHNPPYRGWNWTSALESGMRLVQFTWIDALLHGQAGVWGFKAELERLRAEILPPHVWFTWRYKSFGSSANNHLLGELVGLILAVARWPALTKCGVSLEELKRRWQHEVLAQFAKDGGNKEQALNYQLFSWEFCWQARLALKASAEAISPEVEDRLNRAARFFWEVQVRREPWDYGDSDNAYTTPFFATERTALLEWRDWLLPSGGISIPGYWLGDPPVFAPPLGIGAPPHALPAQGWWIYPETGMAVCESGFWWLRWDLSPLGYLKTAAHGHLDALHLSIWFKGMALIIDPGTGAYYADKQVRVWLASRAAHNGPCPIGEEYPRRLGPFLWAEHHQRPQWKSGLSVESHWRESMQSERLAGELPLPTGLLRRSVTRIDSGNGWQVDDEFAPASALPGEFTVRWQFAPGSWVKRLDQRKFSLHRADTAITIEVGSNWTAVDLVEIEPERKPRATISSDLEGVVSPAFRTTAWAPCLKLTAGAHEKLSVFRTTFLASDLL